MSQEDFEKNYSSLETSIQDNKQGAYVSLGIGVVCSVVGGSAYYWSLQEFLNKDIFDSLIAMVVGTIPSSFSIAGYLTSYDYFRDLKKGQSSLNELEDKRIQNGYKLRLLE